MHGSAGALHCATIGFPRRRDAQNLLDVEHNIVTQIKACEPAKPAMY